MQIEQFARIAQNYAVRVSDFVRKSFLSRVSSNGKDGNRNSRAALEACWTIEPCRKIGQRHKKELSLGSRFAAVQSQSRTRYARAYARH